MVVDNGLTADAVRRGVYYAGYIDFNDGSGATFDQHPLTQDIARDGTASGRQTLDGTQYYDRRQTYEPVPTGHLVTRRRPDGAGNGRGDGTGAAMVPAGTIGPVPLPWLALATALLVLSAALMLRRRLLPSR